MIRFLSNSETDVRKMLETIGVDSMDALFAQIPENVRLRRPLDIPPGLSEPEIAARFTEWARANTAPPDAVLLIGAGTYYHYIPAVVWDVISKPEFYTAYTPYQPEISQGTLQATFEFQTLVCQLTGMEVANASMYDGASALAEAVLMARRIRDGRHVLIAATVHPEYRQTVYTYMRHLGIRIDTIPWDPTTGQIDLDALRSRLQDDTFAVAIQSPNFFGIIEDLAAVRAALADHPAVRIACFTEALSLALLRPPGAFDFDIVVGEGQSFGIPMQFGGPHLGLMATRMRYVRRMPGRLVGATYDRTGKRGFVLTLAAREQHIRREKATSNICTNQALCAIAATAYLALMGPQGLRALAQINYWRAHYLAAQLEQLGWQRPFQGPFFNEFVITHPRSLDVWKRLQAHRILAGVPLSRWYPEPEQALLLCVTEMNDRRELDRFLETVASLTRTA